MALLVLSNSPGNAQTLVGPSAFCHATDGAFTACPDGNEEWSDITPIFFPESNSYLYADQADLDPDLGIPGSPLDTLMLMYDECGRTEPLGPDEYFRVTFDTVEVEDGVEALERYVDYIFADGTLIFIEDGEVQTDASGNIRVAEIEGQRGHAGFGPSPNCPFDHVIVEFEIKLTATGIDLNGGYSPDPIFWSSAPPPPPSPSECTPRTNKIRVPLLINVLSGVTISDNAIGDIANRMNEILHQAALVVTSVRLITSDETLAIMETVMIRLKLVKTCV